MTDSKIYVCINNDNNILSFFMYPTMSREEVRSLFHAAANLSDEDKNVIIKITGKDGSLVPICSSIPPNTPETPYNVTIKKVQKNSIVQKQNETNQKLDEMISALQELESLETMNEKIIQMDNRIKAAEKLVDMNPLACMTTKCAKAEIKHLTKLAPRFEKDQKYVFSKETSDFLKLPSFNNWQWDESEMAALLEMMFMELGVVEHFKIDLPTLRRFLNTIKDNYNKNPFHNFRHCFSVTQMMYSLINMVGLVPKLSPIERLTMLVSTIGHDLDHPAKTNVYQVNAKSELAIIYNDISPLENHHCAMTFTILKEPECNIVKNLNEDDWSQFRKGVIRNILATDMARHNDFVARTKAMIGNFDVNDKEQRELILTMIVKCSDISNEARPAEIADPWVDALLEEFFNQSDLEKVQGLPVMPFMDREKVTKSGAQIGFIGFVMMPLFELVAKFFPEIEVNILPQIRKALVYYKELAMKQPPAAAK